MGNEGSSLLPLRGTNVFSLHKKSDEMYQKKTRRASSSTNRFKESSQKITIDRVIDPGANTKDLSPPSDNAPSLCSTRSNLSPPSNERRRSRSLCASEIQADAQAVSSGTCPNSSKDATSKDPTRKQSTGAIVPNLNRLRIAQCVRSAKPQMGEQILRRTAASRQEIRGFLGRLSDEQFSLLARSLYEMIREAVHKMDSPEQVDSHGQKVGEVFACLSPLGFRPDYFAPIADSAIAECVKLDGGTHRRCETLLAWSQLMSALFSAVRDGYYTRLRYQRRSSLPQNQVSRQASIDIRTPPTVLEH